MAKMLMSEDIMIRENKISSTFLFVWTATMISCMIVIFVYLTAWKTNEMTNASYITLAMDTTNTKINNVFTQDGFLVVAYEDSCKFIEL